ncbi:MAG: DNA adenine methylase [Cyclobacteriaceae bacterium]|nr:DNA adenine methylase [Cyclobacteriaceae bacterium]
MDDSFRHSKYESPLRYPGGKACLFPFISGILYENNLIGTDYAEPYAGGSGLALKLLFNEYVNNIHINDFDYSIYCFWKSILESNSRFCDWLEDVEVSVENWKYFKNIQKNIDDFSQFEIAQSTFFLNRTNVSGVIKGGPIGGFEQRGKYSIDVRFNKEDLINRIKRIQDFKDRISITNYDGLKFINRINKINQNTFVYLDPPYVQKGADLYMNYYKKHDHEQLAKKVNLIKHNWLVSYDNTDFILGLYNKHRKLTYRLAQSASNRIGNEILVFSNGLQFENSLKKLSNPIAV